MIAVPLLMGAPSPLLGVWSLELGVWGFRNGSGTGRAIDAGAWCILRRRVGEFEQPPRRSGRSERDRECGHRGVEGRGGGDDGEMLGAAAVRDREAGAAVA